MENEHLIESLDIVISNLRITNEEVKKKNKNPNGTPVGNAIRAGLATSAGSSLGGSLGNTIARNTKKGQVEAERAAGHAILRTLHPRKATRDLYAKAADNWDKGKRAKGIIQGLQGLSKHGKDLDRAMRLSAPIITKATKAGSIIGGAAAGGAYIGHKVKQYKKNKAAQHESFNEEYKFSNTMMEDGIKDKAIATGNAIKDKAKKAYKSARDKVLSTKAGRQANWNRYKAANSLRQAKNKVIKAADDTTRFVKNMPKKGKIGLAAAGGAAALGGTAAAIAARRKSH